MSELQSRLQAALGPGYAILRELGGGGMSRVFLAEDVSLRRQVVVKVLPPEMGAGINAERFQREVQLAASLQHPHIVPVLSAGANDDLRYYLMPFVDGESLRARLTRHHELPVADTVAVLRDVLSALEAAHRRGVVHRDIKPENVLLSGRHAVITDFGVSKAVSESTQGSPLTSLGVALGTPAYMAPEQAAGDPSIDHRADLYAVGVLAYEMLSGRPPFQASSAHQLLSAHLTKQPEPVTAHRATVPEPLAALVMRCLEKKPADRPQSADELLVALANMPTQSGDVPHASTDISTGTLAAIGRHHPVRLALISALTPLVLIGLFFAVRYAVGVPAWAMTAAVALAALTVPVLIITGRVERQRLLARVNQTTPVGGTLSHFTWRRSIGAGAMAVCLLVIATTAFLVMRAYGIGPAGTLLAKGLYDADEPLLLADFANGTSDSTLGVTVTELVRLDLEQSRVVQLLSPDEVRTALGRMKRAAGTKLSLDLARELAQREQLKALLTGEVTPVGGAVVVAVRLIDAETGATLVARRETAAGMHGIVEAVDRLSAGLRERIGESLRSIQREPRIDAVTTSSFEALQAYMQGIRALDTDDGQRGVELLRRALRLDSSFAMAYRRLGGYYRLRGFPRDSSVRALSLAYSYRTQLTSVEQKMVEATYQAVVQEDIESAIASYRDLLAIYPNHSNARGNMAAHLRALRRLAAAESAYAYLCDRATRRQPLGCGLLASVQMAQGKLDPSEKSIGRAEKLGANARYLTELRAQLAVARGRVDEAERALTPSLEQWRASGNATLAATAELWTYNLAFLRGQVRQGVAHRLAHSRQFRRVNPFWWPEPLLEAYWRLSDDVFLRRPTQSSLDALVAALPGARLEERPSADRGYQLLAVVLAQAGDTARAREYVDRYVLESTDLGPRTRARQAAWAQGYLAIARGETAAGIALLREWERYTDNPLNIWQVARAYDWSNQPDSAEVLYRRMLEMPAYSRVSYGGVIPLAMRRVGELADARGDRETARKYYTQFVELWKDSDPENQVIVRRVRARLKEL